MYTSMHAQSSTSIRCYPAGAARSGYAFHHHHLYKQLIGVNGAVGNVSASHARGPCMIQALTAALLFLTDEALGPCTYLQF